jgi:hypothetical protein
MKLWDLLIELLLEGEQHKSCEIACDIIWKIENFLSTGRASTDEISLKQSASGMIVQIVKLFTRAFETEYPLKTCHFLIDQYLLVSECDSNPNENDVN